MAEKLSESKEENKTLGIVGGAVAAVGWALIEFGEIFLILDPRDKFRDTLKTLAIIIGGGLTIAAIGKALSSDAKQTAPKKQNPLLVEKPSSEISPQTPSVTGKESDTHHSSNTRRWQNQVVDKIEGAIRSV